MKQTVEQAAMDYLTKQMKAYGTRRSNGDVYRAFVAGAKWQKGQGK